MFSPGLLGLSRFGLLRRVLVGCLLVVLFVEAAALVLVNFPVLLNLPFASSSVAMHWRMVELSLSNLAYPILPYAYVLLIVLGIGAFLVKAAPKTRLPQKFAQNKVVAFYRSVRSSVESSKAQAYEPLSGRFPLGLVLLISFLVSIVFVVVTVLPWINPTYRLVSVDAPAYYQWLAHMRGLDFNSALTFAFTNDRGAFLFLSYALSFATSPVNVVQLIPALLLVLFCVVSLLVARFVCGFREVWGYAVLLVPFSLQGLGLIYSGYFANILAVIFVYLYFVLLLKVFRSSSIFGVLSLLIVSLLVLFSHSWTWYIFVLSLGAFLFLEWRLAAGDRGLWKGFKWKFSIVIVTVILGLAVDWSRTLFTSSSASASVFETAKSSLGFPNAGYILGGLKLTTNFYLGGVFANAIIIGLSIIGFLYMLTFKSEMSRLLVSWFFVGCVSLLFASSEFVFNRFLFLMPSVIFSSLGLSYLVRVGVYGSKGSHAKKVAFEFLLVGFVVLCLLNFGLRYVLNLNLT